MQIQNEHYREIIKENITHIWLKDFGINSYVFWSKSILQTKIIYFPVTHLNSTQVTGILTKEFIPPKTTYKRNKNAKLRNIYKPKEAKIKVN